jgi:hypothetical protein
MLADRVRKVKSLMENGGYECLIDLLPVGRSRVQLCPLLVLPEIASPIS